MYFLLDDDICAPSTAQGSAALAMIRCTGPGCLEKLQSVFKRDVQKLKPSQTVFARFYHHNVVLDECMLSVFKAPKSFTGEDMAEISLHGSPFIVQKALSILADEGFRMAEGGEFSFRAYSHGKLDLSQTEAIADLIASENEASHQLAMRQLRGGYSEMMDALRQELLNFASLIELELDFAEEDVEFANRDALLELLNRVIGTCKELCASFSLGNAIKKGVPVAIIGKPNAGKSTLLNALLRDDRAIVSDIAGTTRDTIEDVSTINGIAFRFIDTAGLRESVDKIEQEGIKRSKKSIEKAEIVLALYDSQAENLEEELAFLEKTLGDSQAKILFIATKMDCSPYLTIPTGHFGISSANAKDLAFIEQALSEAVNQDSRKKAPATISNLRHYQALKQCSEALEAMVYGMAHDVPSDLLTVELKRAIQAIGSITGVIDNEEVLGNIFQNFCIGK